MGKGQLACPAAYGPSSVLEARQSRCRNGCSHIIFRCPSAKWRAPGDLALDCAWGVRNRHTSGPIRTPVARSAHRNRWEPPRSGGWLSAWPPPRRNPH